MFNTTHVHRTNYIPYTKEVNVTEHRAPTDESIKILNEMEEKAIANAIKKINVVDNTVNAAVVYFIHDMTSFHNKYVVKFTFNGKEYTLNGIIDNTDLYNHSYGSDKATIALYKSLALLFAEHVLTNTERLADHIRQAFQR